VSDQLLLTKKLNTNSSDKIIYGLPDTFYIQNLFAKLLARDGIVIGMYKIHDHAVVGRYDIQKKYL
jgi:hypothetical protein